MGTRHRASSGPISEGSQFADSDVQAKLSPMALSDGLRQLGGRAWRGPGGWVTQPACEGGGGHSPELGTHRGWHRTEKLGLRQHPGARRDKAGRALPAPAHGKAPLSAPLLIGSSFSLGPPGEEGALPGGRFAWHSSLSPENSLQRQQGWQLGMGGGWSVEAGEEAQTSHPRNIKPPSISGQGGGAEGGEGGAALGTHRQPGGTGRASPWQLL